MKVLFFSCSMPDLIMPTLPLGMVSVATAVQQADHDVKLLDLLPDCDFEAAVTAALKDFMPDAIGIAVRNIDDQSMADTRFLLEPIKTITATCRALSKVPIILGGAGYSMYPERLLEWLDGDIGIVGDGEAGLPAVPYTLNMKKVELAVKKIIEGQPVLNRDALGNPEALDYYENLPELQQD